MAFHPAIDQVIQYFNTICRSGSLLMYMIIISSNTEKGLIFQPQMTISSSEHSQRINSSCGTQGF